MTLRNRFHLVLLAILACSAPSQKASAEQPDAIGSRAADSPSEPGVDDTSRKRAAELKQSGNAAMVSLRYADALEAYTGAYALDPDPALLYNLGRALQALERYPEALEKLKAFSETAPSELRRRVPKLAELIAEVREHVSELVVTSNASGARVLIRDRVVGRTPLAKPLALNAGRALIEVSAEGYFPFRKTVVLPASGEFALHAELVPRARSAILTIRTNARGARVLVDGKLVGVAPAETVVGPGSHRISARHADYYDAETTAVVRAGENKVFSVVLEPTLPVTQRWWFWTGAAVVVAGGVALTAALLTERDPDEGDIAPGQISAPLLRY